MTVSMEYAWGGTGREPLLVIYEDGHRVASFEDEGEAVQWMRDEYGDDIADNVEIK